LQRAAWAVRFGQYADKKEWEKFMRHVRKQEPLAVKDVEAMASAIGAKVKKQGQERVN
jgi:hypothetical protein